jgi:hypothetical protein
MKTLGPQRLRIVCSRITGNPEIILNCCRQGLALIQPNSMTETDAD